MSARIAAVLLLLLAVLGGGALLVRQQRAAEKPADSALLGQPLLKNLPAAQVAKIALRSPAGAITVQKKDDRWTVAERGGFPADFGKVRDFVLQAIGLRIAQSEAIARADRARFKLDAGATTVEFFDAAGTSLARLSLGEKYFRTGPEDRARAVGDGRYVMLPGDERRVYVVADPLTQASVRSADWVSTAGFAAEKVRSLEVQRAEGRGWRIERDGDNADWKLAGAAKGEKLEVTSANSAAYSLSLLGLADVAPPDVKPGQTGLDEPTVVSAQTFDGLTYTLRLGKLEGQNYYATLEVAGEPKAEGPDAAKRQPKLAERVAHEKALAGYVLLIPKSKLDDVLRKRADLLQKKPEKKPPR